MTNERDFRISIAVVIPVLNERPNLPACVTSVRRGIPGARIVITDGGSSDGSIEWVRTQPDLHLVAAPGGKGPQLNAGAAAALDAEALVFLHADSELPPNAGEWLHSALSNPATAGGCFFVRFVERKPLSLHLLAWGMNARAVILHRSFGDQALFIRRSIFNRMGGFPDWPLFEDYELVRRMKRHGKFAVLFSPVLLSSRRFLLHGVWRTVARVLALQLGFYCGIPPTHLKHWFADIRPHLKANE